jgi:Mg2+ and Co2+ transporter CorA
MNPDGENKDSDIWEKDGNLNANWIVYESKDKVIESLLQAIKTVDEYKGDLDQHVKGLSRSTSCAQRASYILTQELSCHASCETFAMQIKKLLGRDVDLWIQEGNNI